MVKWKEVGHKSSQRGKAFERKCRDVMTQVTGYPRWRRTVAGHEQIYGDLIPVAESGKQVDLIGGPIFVECKMRSGNVTTPMWQGWISTCLQMMQNQRMNFGYLLVGVGSVIFVILLRRGDNVALTIRQALVYCKSA